MGWVSPNWSLGKELSPLMSTITDAVVVPIIGRLLEGMPDESLPSIAHNLVDAALVNGSLSLFEGNIVFEKEDLEELKNYLNWNLPLGESPAYEVKTSGDNE